MKYLKIFTDFVIDMEALGDAERGRLFTAMLLYAETGEDVELKGNERFIWAKTKANIDACRQIYSEKVANIERARGNRKKS